MPDAEFSAGTAHGFTRQYAPRLSAYTALEATAAWRFGKPSVAELGASAPLDRRCVGHIRPARGRGIGPGLRRDAYVSAGYRF